MIIYWWKKYISLNQFVAIIWALYHHLLNIVFSLGQWFQLSIWNVSKDLTFFFEKTNCNIGNHYMKHWTPYICMCVCVFVCIPYNVFAHTWFCSNIFISHTSSSSYWSITKYFLKHTSNVGCNGCNWTSETIYWNI